MGDTSLCRRRRRRQCFRRKLDIMQRDIYIRLLALYFFILAAAAAAERLERLNRTIRLYET